VAQVLGAIAGATLVWLYFLPHWSVTPEADLKRACFCTSPAIRRPASNLLCEIIGTFVLVLVVSAISPKPWRPAAGGGSGPVPCGEPGMGHRSELGGTTGYAINPARDLGPRIAHALLPVAGKGGSDWPYAAVPVAGPLLGGALAGLFARLAQF